MLSHATLATIAGLAICESLGRAAEYSDTEDNKPGWEFSLESYTYLAQHARDYSNPNFTAIYNDWLHLEARYNYEALKTGSVWVGRKFTTGKTLEIDVTPMLGGVFGDITGVAPGYLIEATYKETIELSTQGEYFFDAGNSSGNFFYSWSEFSAWATDWFKVGLVVERTQASGNSDVRRGPLVGFKHKCEDKDLDLTIYWLAPGSRDATFVFGVTVEF